MDLGEKLVLIFLFKVLFIDFFNYKKSDLQVCNNFDGYQLWYQHGYERKINMCLLMSMLFILLIQTKFDIDINNDELLETIRGHKKKDKIIYHHYTSSA